MIAGLNNNPLTTKLFGDDIKLFPNVNNIFELELAYLEFCNLSKDELLSRSAYIESIKGKEIKLIDKKLIPASTMIDYSCIHELKNVV